MNLRVILSAASLLGCSGWEPESVHQLTAVHPVVDDPAAAAAPVPHCTKLEAGTFEVWAFYSVPADYKSPAGMRVTPGTYELESWRLWHADNLTTSEYASCKPLLWSYQAATPRMQVLRLSESDEGVHQVALRTDFPELPRNTRTASLEFDVAFDGDGGVYRPISTRAECSLATGDPARVTWYGVDPLAESAMRLIAVPEGLVVEVPFQSHSFCGVVEHYVPVGVAEIGDCIPPDPCKSRRRG